MKRRLVSILIGDLVGYSAMVEADVEGTPVRIGRLTRMRLIFV